MVRLVALVQLRASLQDTWIRLERRLSHNLVRERPMSPQPQPQALARLTAVPALVVDPAAAAVAVIDHQA